ncbi:helix-turn-helix domain-containing protein, partial [Paracoccus thiocyanatus]
ELENLMRRLALTAAAAQITEAEAAAALAESGPVLGRAAPAGGVTPANAPALAEPAGMRLAQSVEMHLQRYFALHGGDLPPAGLYDRILREIERPLLEIALDATGGNQLRCADLLGINRNTLRKKLTDLNIEVTRRRKLM